MRISLFARLCTAVLLLCGASLAFAQAKDVFTPAWPDTVKFTATKVMNATFTMPDPEAETNEPMTVTFKVVTKNTLSKQADGGYLQDVTVESFELDAQGNEDVDISKFPKLFKGVNYVLAIDEQGKATYSGNHTPDAWLQANRTADEYERLTNGDLDWDTLNSMFERSSFEYLSFTGLPTAVGGRWFSINEAVGYNGDDPIAAYRAELVGKPGKVNGKPCVALEQFESNDVATLAKTLACKEKDITKAVKKTLPAVGKADPKIANHATYLIDPDTMLGYQMTAESTFSFLFDWSELLDEEVVKKMPDNGKVQCGAKITISDTLVYE